MAESCLQPTPQGVKDKLAEIINQPGQMTDSATPCGSGNVHGLPQHD
jgi:hypothetical protein